MATAEDISGGDAGAIRVHKRPVIGREDEIQAIRLRTLIRLRWFAMLGQALAVAVAVLLFDLILPLELVLVTIGASLTTTLLGMFVYSADRRLTEVEAMFGLGFDICQLAVLLGLTGGLNNPFALLLLAPVTISASVLSLRSTILLCGLAIALILTLGAVYVPMRWADGTAMLLPPLFRFGFELALLIGTVFLAVYARQVTSEMHAMRGALTATQLALEREQKLTDLGGVVAATAHELGTPLATIKLAASELRDELGDHASWRADAELIAEQADRCRDILRSMGRAGKMDLQMRVAPIEAVLREAAEPHLDRRANVAISAGAASGSTRERLEIWRKPEIVHGLRNLIQNAVDFARADVTVAARWTVDRVEITITDDGPGFPESVLDRIGSPFLRRRTAEAARHRPDYEGMGLGLFIAKTLLERTGASLTFTNRPEGHGALVTVGWARSAIEAGAPLQGRGLGENRLILP